MPFKVFLQQLFVMVLISAGCIVGIHNNVAQHHADFSWIMLLYLGVLSFVFYIAGQRTLQNSNPNTFSYFFLLGTGFKMLSSLILLWFYKSENNPEDGVFVLPFLIMYVLFMIFEIYFLSKISNSK